MKCPTCGRPIVINVYGRIPQHTDFRTGCYSICPASGRMPAMTAELVCAATDPAWLEWRREGITATDIVTIAGLVTWDSPWALYHRKLGELPEVEQSDRMRLGSGETDVLRRIGKDKMDD